MSLSQIIEGTYNNITNKKEQLSAERMAICKECKLYFDTHLFGPICDPSLYIHPVTKKVSIEKEPGNISGCGCILNSKTRVEEAQCPGKKW